MIERLEGELRSQPPEHWIFEKLEFLKTMSREVGSKLIANR